MTTRYHLARALLLKLDPPTPLDLREARVNPRRLDEERAEVRAAAVEAVAEAVRERGIDQLAHPTMPDLSDEELEVIANRAAEAEASRAAVRMCIGDLLTDHLLGRCELTDHMIEVIRDWNECFDPAAIDGVDPNGEHAEDKASLRAARILNWL